MARVIIFFQYEGTPCLESRASNRLKDLVPIYLYYHLPGFVARNAIMIQFASFTTFCLFAGDNAAHISDCMYSGADI